MTPVQFYDEITLRFPPLWPLMPEWEWVNVHDGQVPMLKVIAGLLNQHIGTQEVVILVHSEPGVAVTLPIESAAKYVATHILQHEIQVSDPLFEHFVSVSKTGLATGDA